MALLAEYGFNENTGASTADLSGNGHDLGAPGSASWGTGHTGTGGIAWWSGAWGPNTSQTAWTIMCWVKVDTAPGSGAWKTIAYTTNGGEIYLEVGGHGSNSTMHFDCYAGVGGEPNSANIYSTATWYHIAATCTAGAAELFVNGVSVATGAAQAHNFNEPGAVYTIASEALGANPFPGTVDDFRVFSTALTASEVTAWMNQPAGSGAPSVGGATPRPVISRAAIQRASSW